MATQSVVQQDLEAILARDLPWERFSGCRVAVSGGSGFIGGYLVRTLLSLFSLGKVSVPVRVVVLVRDIARAKSRLRDMVAISGDAIEFVQCDLRDIAIPDLGDVQYIFHAASHASPRFYSQDPVGTIVPNVVGTTALLTALCKSADPRGFLFISSSEVYGAASSDQALSESALGVVDQTQLRACYSEGKRAGETLCVAFHHQFGVPVWMVRPFHTYGPGLQADDGRVFSDFAYNVLRGENIVMNSDGSARRAFCYISDAIAGMFTVVLKGQPGVAFNVANPNAELSVMELAELLVSLYPEKRLRVERNYSLDPNSYVPSPYNKLTPDTALLASMGWQATVSPASGFKRMIEALEHE
ncbi:NAD-dependent epimerase/dehydratase family protein [Chitinibacteraceae bacterium HSL-7]